MNNTTLVSFAALPLLLVACAAPQNPPVAANSAQPQVSCVGQAPRVGTNIVRKSDCEPLSPEDADTQRQRFEAMQQAQEAARARREAAPTPPR